MTSCYGHWWEVCLDNNKAMSYKSYEIFFFTVSVFGQKLKHIICMKLGYYMKLDYLKHRTIAMLLNIPEERSGQTVYN